MPISRKIPKKEQTKQKYETVETKLQNVDGNSVQENNLV